MHIDLSFNTYIIIVIISPILRWVSIVKCCIYYNILYNQYGSKLLSKY